MTREGKKGKPLRPGKNGSSPASGARAERPKKGAGKRAAGSMPKVEKGSEGTGRKGGGLH